MPGYPCARPEAVRSEARCSARHGTRPCTGRSGRLCPPSGPCAASARGSVRGPTWRSRGRRKAARAGRRPRPRGKAGTCPPPPPRGRACVGPNVCRKPSLTEARGHQQSARAVWRCVNLSPLATHNETLVLFPYIEIRFTIFTDSLYRGVSFCDRRKPSHSSFALLKCFTSCRS